MSFIEFEWVVDPDCPPNQVFFMPRGTWQRMKGRGVPPLPTEAELDAKRRERNRENVAALGRPAGEFRRQP